MLVPLVMIISSIALLSHCFTIVETASEDPVIFVNPVQPEKAELPIFVTLSRIVILANLAQFLKATFVIFPPVIVTDFMLDGI